MVDGIDVGVNVVVGEDRTCKNGCNLKDNSSCSDCQDGKTTIEQDFKDADFLVIESEPFSHKIRDGKLGNDTEIEETTQSYNENYYYCYAIYGNTVVKSMISGLTVSFMKNSNNYPKIVWSYKKPYILNGD